MGGVAWSEEEDHLLKKCIERYGEGKWHRIPVLAGLNRCRKSCRLRWLNYLRPNIKRGSFAEEEINLIIKLHGLLGRTANDVKNYWNCHLSKKLVHAPRIEHQTVTNMEKFMTPHPPNIATTKPTDSDHTSPDNQPKTEEKAIMWTPLTDIEVDRWCQDLVEEPGRFADHQFSQFDEGGGSNSSKWDWDDSIFDIDLWTL
ncbi:hypothetical protein V6N13_067674 [Hibiscus sabdariffa]|uniref:Uncharacterized protein n=1 Tax=Hibiscus sabdariffa TaxID=183260 RepID=A0ABR2DXE7_9ROSI